MQAYQRTGIDLPLKALVWEDGDGTVWLTYNDPAWVARRHTLGPPIGPIVHAMSAMLAAVTRYATKIGIGGCLTAPPLPHHRAYGSVPRRFD